MNRHTVREPKTWLEWVKWRRNRALQRGRRNPSGSCYRTRKTDFTRAEGLEAGTVANTGSQKKNLERANPLGLLCRENRPVNNGVQPDAIHEREEKQIERVLRTGVAETRRRALSGTRESRKDRLTRVPDAPGAKSR
jgi:hypothetical protein